MPSEYILKQLSYTLLGGSTLKEVIFLATTDPLYIYLLYKTLFHSDGEGKLWDVHKFFQ